MFNCDPASYTDGFIRLHTVGDILDEVDYESWWDEERTRKTVAERLDDFACGEFPEINRIVVECLEEHRAGMG